MNQMEQKTQPQKTSNKELHKTFKPCNKYLLCKKVEIDEKVGNIILADPDKWQRRFRVVAASPDLLSYLDHYDVGDELIYPLGAPTMFIQIDDEEYFFVDKQIVISKVLYGKD